MIDPRYRYESADALIAIHVPLTWDEQVRLFQTRGGPDWLANRDRLFACYTPLIVSRTNYFLRQQRREPTSNIFDDILSEMCSLALRCLDLFDPSSGYRFTTYFYRGVLSVGYRFLGRHAYPVVLPAKAVTSAEIRQRVGRARSIERHGDLQHPYDHAASCDATDLTQYLADRLPELAKPEECYAIGRYLLGDTLQAIGDSLSLHRFAVQYRIRKVVQIIQDCLGEDVWQANLTELDAQLLGRSLLRQSGFSVAQTA